MNISGELLKKFQEPFPMTEEYDLYEEWLCLSIEEIMYYEWNFQNYLSVEIFFRRMEIFLSLILFLAKNFDKEYSKNKWIFYEVIQFFQKIEKPKYFTSFDMYKFDFLEFQYCILKKKFYEREKLEYLLLFYKGDFQKLNSFDIVYQIFQYL